VQQQLAQRERLVEETINELSRLYQLWRDTRLDLDMLSPYTSPNYITVPDYNGQPGYNLSLTTDQFNKTNGFTISYQGGRRYSVSVLPSGAITSIVRSDNSLRELSTADVRVLLERAAVEAIDIRVNGG